MSTIKVLFALVLLLGAGSAAFAPALDAVAGPIVDPSCGDLSQSDILTPTVTSLQVPLKIRGTLDPTTLDCAGDDDDCRGGFYPK